MPKFILSCQVTVSAWTEVHAESLAEVIELSKDRPVDIGRNHDNSAAAEDCWIIEEGDGTPKEITE